MTNLQLLLTIGIPSLLVIVSWLSNNSRLSDIRQRLDSLEKRFNENVTHVNGRFTEIERRFTDVERHFADAASATSKAFADAATATSKRFDDVIASNHRDALEIMRSMTALHERVAVVESRQAA